MGSPVIQNPIYKPVMRLISAITNSNPASVTTTVAHGYNTGQIVRIFLPAVAAIQLVAGVPIRGFGMQQINNLQGVITTTDDPTVFTIDIDSTLFTPFVIPPDQVLQPSGTPAPLQYPQSIPVGGYNTNTAFLDALPF